MLTETYLVQEFLRLMERTHPQADDLLRHCHIKLVTSHWGHPPRRLDYMAIYCPNTLFQSVCDRKPDLRSISQYMGLAEPVCINVFRILRDPKSKLKQEAPRFWLELHQLLQEQETES